MIEENYTYAWQKSQWCCSLGAQWPRSMHRSPCRNRAVPWLASMSHSMRPCEGASIATAERESF